MFLKGEKVILRPMTFEEIPMASFIKMEGNQKFLDYISENTNQ
jgi:hypothetical protein